MEKQPFRVPARKKIIIKKNISLNRDSSSEGGRNQNPNLEEDQERIGSEKYTLRDEIGEGITGKVYLAKHNLLETSIAIKIFNKEITKEKEEIENLKKEARIGMNLSNRYILKTFGLEKNNETYFLCMEYAKMGSLRKILNNSENISLELEHTKTILESCSTALVHAHKHSVIHGDLKPSNILVAELGVIKLADFGASLYKNQQGKYIRGTPIYMSPEQKKGKDIDEKTDIYSLGEIIYELLVGESRYPQKASLEEVLNTSPGEMIGLPDPISEVLKKATAEEKQKRYSDIWEFRNSFFKSYNSLK
jgi:eukaryotic-like serine/threonine-protein kinase